MRRVDRGYGRRAIKWIILQLGVGAVALFLCHGVLVVAPSYGVTEVDITRGVVEPYPIAITQFYGDGVDESELGGNLSDIIGHNLENFDLQFLNHYLNTELKNEFIDTLHLSRSVLGNKVANHKLNTLAIYFDVNPPTHSARDDVMTTFEIYKKLLSIQ